jgi:RNA:NAD 2'-phosphotransferase (TPT1/KptA family)
MTKLVVHVNQAPAFWLEKRIEIRLARLTTPLEKGLEHLGHGTPRKVHTQVSGNGLRGPVPQNHVALLTDEGNALRVAV